MHLHTGISLEIYAGSACSIILAILRSMTLSTKFIEPNFKLVETGLRGLHVDN